MGKLVLGLIVGFCLAMAISADISAATNFWVSFALFAVTSFIYFDRDHIFRRLFRAWLHSRRMRRVVQVCNDQARKRAEAYLNGFQECAGDFDDCVEAGMRKMNEVT